VSPWDGDDTRGVFKNLITSDCVSGGGRGAARPGVARRVGAPTRRALHVHCTDSVRIRPRRNRTSLLQFGLLLECPRTFPTPSTTTNCRELSRCSPLRKRMAQSWQIKWDWVSVRLSLARSRSRSRFSAFFLARVSQRKRISGTRSTRNGVKTCS